VFETSVRDPEYEKGIGEVADLIEERFRAV
jgi:hypothetical protein